MAEETATDVEEPETAETVAEAESTEETAQADPIEDAETQPAEGNAADDATPPADSEADGDQAETATDVAAETPGDDEDAPEVNDVNVPPASLDVLASLSPEVREEIRRILRLEVPVIVKLADKQLPLGDIIDLSPGSIVEFARSADTPLELLVNNKIIGRGVAVKVGEKFGLRIDELLSVEETIRTLGV